MPVTPITGARKLSQFQHNLASFDLTLSADQLKTLTRQAGLNSVYVTASAFRTTLQLRMDRLQR